MPRRGVVTEPYRHYTQSILRELKWRGTWFPQEQLDLGDVGILDDGVFELETTIEELGVPFHRRVGKNKAKFDYQSSSGVSVRTKAAGEAALDFTSLGKAKAGVLIRFGRAGAVVFSVPSSRIVQIDQRQALARSIRALRNEGGWNRDWVVVTRLVEARSATVLVSGATGAEVVLRAKATASPASIDLAKIGAGFELASHSDMAIRIVASGGLTPLYRAEDLGR